MKKVLVVVAWVAVLLVACGPTDVVVLEPTATQVPCTRTQYLEVLGALPAQWDDAFDLARSTPRMTIAPLIAELQAIRRETEVINVPACAVEAHRHLVEYMSLSIDGFVSFLASDTDATFMSYFDRAQAEFRLWQAEMERLPFAGD